LNDMFGLLFHPLSMCRVTAEEIYYTPSFSKLPSKETHYFSAIITLDLTELIIISMGHVFRQGLQILLWVNHKP
jgi:hypothetical protein